MTDGTGGATMARRPKRGFGQLTKMRSGRIQARYTGPDGSLHYAPTTFDSREDAEAWLVDERRKISEGRWTPPTTTPAATAQVVTFGEYAEKWMTRRDLKPRTDAHYRSLLDRQILPTFSAVPLREITSEAIRDWWADRDRSRPTLWSHAYGLLLSTAVTKSPLVAM